jgi:plastocyanin
LSLRAAEVTATVRTAGEGGDPSGAVVSLTPVDSAGRAALKEPSAHAILLQKNKTFSPHVLVIPPGSTVDFPNDDPFFHNVFSLFEGKRFDLGLYESGASRSVKFDRTGVSYIFCNIHPQMSAIVISLGTPYYSIVGSSGEAKIGNVQPGEYLMQVWAEGLTREEMGRLSKRVTVADVPVRLGVLEIPSTETLAQHKNKYGRSYDPTTSAPYEPH